MEEKENNIMREKKEMSPKERRNVKRDSIMKSRPHWREHQDESSASEIGRNDARSLL